MKKIIVAISILVLLFGIAYFSGLQYDRASEKRRWSEARFILQQLRQSCGTLFENNGNTSECNAQKLGIGYNKNLLPGPNLEVCSPEYYFWYSVQNNGVSGATFIATRCLNGGKEPQGTTSDTLTLFTDYSNGQDKWGGSRIPTSPVPHTPY